MSYFGTCLDELMKRKRLTGADLARLSGVGQPMISRYKTGEQQWVDPADLGRLAKAISSDPAEQAELVRARLLDECHGPGSELVRIEIATKARQDEPPSHHQVKLPPELENAINTIREWVMKDTRVREIIEGLGGLLYIDHFAGPPAPVLKRGKPLRQPSPERVADAVADHMFKRNVAKVISSRQPDDADSEHTSGKSESPASPERGGAQGPPPRPPSGQTKTSSRPTSRKGKARPGSKP